MPRSPDFSPDDAAAHAGAPAASRPARRLPAAAGRPMKDDIRSLGRATEDAVRHSDMVVDVEVEATAEALGKAYRTAADVGRARGLCVSRVHQRCAKLLALPTPDFSHEDATDGAKRRRVAC